MSSTLNPDGILFELIPIAEEIKHGKGTPEKSLRLAELVLKLNDHLFNGGQLPQAWFIPLITSFEVDPFKPEVDDPFHDSDEKSGVHEVDFDLSCFDEPKPFTDDQNVELEVLEERVI